MRIDSINSKKTKGPHNAAFNISGEVDEEAFNRIDYGVLSLSIEDGILFVNAPENAKPLEASTIRTIQSKYDEKLNEVESERRHAAEKHLEMLKNLRQRLQLEIDDKSI